MRKQTVTTICAALLLASAQQAPRRIRRTKPGARAGIPTVGVRRRRSVVTSTDGDEARYERYRDLRNGAVDVLSCRQEHRSYRFNARRPNAGYRDQRYRRRLHNEPVTVNRSLRGIPLNYSYDRSPLTTGAASSR